MVVAQVEIDRWEQLEELVAALLADDKNKIQTAYRLALEATLAKEQ